MRSLPALLILALSLPVGAATASTVGSPGALLGSSCAVSEHQPTCASSYVSSGSDGRITITAERISGTGTITCKANSYGSELDKVTSNGAKRSKTINVGANRNVSVLGFQGDGSDFGKCTIS